MNRNRLLTLGLLLSLSWLSSGCTLWRNWTGGKDRMRVEVDASQLLNVYVVVDERGKLEPLDNLAIIGQLSTFYASYEFLIDHEAEVGEVQQPPGDGKRVKFLDRRTGQNTFELVVQHANLQASSLNEPVFLFLSEFKTGDRFEYARDWVFPAQFTEHAFRKGMNVQVNGTGKLTIQPLRN